MRKLLLVGGGHAHLNVIKALRKAPIKDVEVVLISPSQYQYYSGMFSGFTEGIYTKDQCRIDLASLTKSSSVKWIEGAVISIDAEQKLVLTEKGDVISFDAVSFDIGSLTAGNANLSSNEHIHTIKPNYNVINTINEIKRADHAVIVGGGAAGIEISSSLSSWRSTHNLNLPVTLISGNRLLEKKSEKVTANIKKSLNKRNINILENEKVTDIKSNKLITSSNKSLQYDKVLWLTGPKAPNIFKVSKLPVDKKGYLLVEDTLQVKKYPFIFGAGDCVSLTNYPSLEKNGVHAIKQGHILHQNLRGFFETGEGVLYKPQKNVLSILSLGDKEGFFMYKDYSLTGKWAWHLKNYIDTTYMKKYKINE